jgi:hypothetical protein
MNTAPSRRSFGFKVQQPLHIAAIANPNSLGNIAQSRPSQPGCNDGRGIASPDIDLPASFSYLSTGNLISGETPYR